MSVEIFAKHYLPLIEKRLDELLTFHASSHNPLFEAARYTTLAGGKRLRPLIALATAESLGGDPLRALTPACALELVHCYSLVHDDLPCMDDDDYRRGQLTLHKKYDEATAVLTGDFLLTYAFEVILEAPNLSTEEKVALSKVLAKRAGGHGMIAGQFLDLEAEDRQVTLDELQQIHRKKTAEMLIASFEFGALLSQSSSSVIEQLQLLGEELGLAFQIIDDVLDVTASHEKHGRPISSDALQGKSTYVSHLGLTQAQQAADSLLKTSLERIQQMPLRSNLLSSLAVQLVERAH